MKNDDATRNAFSFIPSSLIPHPIQLIDMAQQLQLEVVTPERRVLSEAVDIDNHSRFER